MPDGEERSRSGMAYALFFIPRFAFRPGGRRATGRPAPSTFFAALPAVALVAAPGGSSHRLPEGGPRGEA